MNDADKSPGGNSDQDPEETPVQRRNTNIVLALFFVLLVGSGYWLVNAMQGRRNCNPVTIPDRN